MYPSKSAGGMLALGGWTSVADGTIHVGELVMLVTPSKRRAFWAERQFGRGVGGILILIGGWLSWQDTGSAVSWIVLAVGVLLVLSGSIYPRVLVWPNRGWMRMAEGVSWVSTRVVLGLVFSIAVTPIGVVKRLMGWDPLGRRRPAAESYWVAYPSRQRNPKHFERMF